MKAKREKREYQIIINGKVWTNYLTQSQADRKAIEARQNGLGMAYVEKMSK